MKRTKVKRPAPKVKRPARRAPLTVRELARRAADDGLEMSVALVPRVTRVDGPGGGSGGPLPPATYTRTLELTYAEARDLVNALGPSTPRALQVKMMSFCDTFPGPRGDS